MTYPSTLPGFFPDLHHCHSVLTAFHLPTLDGLRLVKGLCEGVLLGKDAIAGFPSLNTLPHTGQLGYQGVNVFQAESRNETMVIAIDNTFEGAKVEDVGKAMIGKTTYVNWPYLKEALVVAVTDELFRYEMHDHGGHQQVRSVPHRPDSLVSWRRSAERAEHHYSKRYGVIIGGVDVMVHVRMLKGLKLMEDGAMVKEFDTKESEFALQTTVQNVVSLDARYIVRMRSGL